jgi:hypothetical protein
MEGCRVLLAVISRETTGGSDEKSPLSGDWKGWRVGKVKKVEK